jgi:glutathione synthase
MIDRQTFFVYGRILDDLELYSNLSYAVAAFSSGGDMRSNITAGAKASPAVITDEMLELTEVIRAQLVKNGMFFVGLDIVGNKLMETNVFSPGGLPMAETFTGIKFSQIIIRELERKLNLLNRTGRNASNTELAVI